MFPESFADYLRDVVRLAMKAGSLTSGDVAAKCAMSEDEVDGFLRALDEGRLEGSLSDLAEICSALELQPILTPANLTSMFFGQVEDALDPIQSVYEEVFVPNSALTEMKLK